jgi:hypothetical protein
MEALDTIYIFAVSKDEDIEVADVDSTASAYIRELLTPYAEAVDQATSTESVRAWINQVYPPRLAQGAQEWVDKARYLSDAAREAIAYVVAELLHAAQPYTIGVMVPWNVKRGLRQARATPGSVADLVTVTADDTLPVTIRLNGQDHLHQLSQDFVAGLQDYYRYAGGTVEVLVAGVPLSTYYLTDESSPYDESDAIELPYRVTFIQPGQDPEDGDERVFSSLDYIQGAATAALWLGQDFHTRLVNLVRIDAMMKAHRLTF